MFLVIFGCSTLLNTDSKNPLQSAYRKSGGETPVGSGAEGQEPTERGLNCVDCGRKRCHTEPSGSAESSATEG